MLKVSDTKVVSRPRSTYLGLIMVAYVASINFLSEALVYSVVFWISLLVISAIFVVKGEVIELDATATHPSDTKRNAMILLGFIAVLVATFVYIGKF